MQRPIRTESVARPGAFLGKISTDVRSTATGLCRERPGDRVLDVGCGNGLLFAEMGSHKAPLTGLDMDRQLLAEGAKVLEENSVGGVCLMLGNASLMPFPVDTFDTVMFLNSLMVLENEETAGKIIKELARVTAPGGRIVADIRNNRNLILCLRYWAYNRSRGFVARGYDLHRIAGLFEAVGCEIRDTHPIGPWLPFGPSALVLEAVKRAD